MEKIDYEVGILSRPYSVLRRRQNKWKYRGSPSDSFVIMVDLDYFSTKDLLQRKSLKRSKRIFGEISRFWQLINPFSIPGLSRVVYSAILRFIYKGSFKMHLNEPVFEQYLNNDISQDFKDEFCLFFCDFYDAFFDIIDQITSGKSVPEYVSAISYLLTQLKYSETLNLINLNNKSHCSGKKPRYVLWMKEFINIRESHLNDLKSLPRIQSNKHYLDTTSPLSIKKRPGMGMKSFLLEEIIEGRNKFLSAYHEEKKRAKAKEVLKKMTGKSYV